MNCCPGNALSRRDFLTVGAIGGLGLSLPTLLPIAEGAGGAEELREQGRHCEECHLYLLARRYCPPGVVRPEAVRACRVSRTARQHRHESARGSP